MNTDDWSLHLAMADGLDDAASNCSSQQKALAVRLTQAAAVIRAQHSENTELNRYIDSLRVQNDLLRKRLERMSEVYEPDIPLYLRVLS